MAEVIEVDRLKRQFLAALNHEVRTPLSGILGMTSLLEQSDLTAQQREYVSLTKACAEELYAALSSTLELTALSAGDNTLDKSDFLLQEAIESLAAQWLVKARQKGVNFYLKLSDDLPETARGDELRFRKLLQHLLSNAVKFTDKGQIHLNVDFAPHVSDPSSFVLKVDIEDSGIGMNEDEIKRVFESFEQLENGLARRYPGLGLGLTLAQGLSAVLGGELTLTSVPGQGSVLSFAIPLGYSSLGTTFQTPADTRILVVDDNEAARKVAEAYLKRGGYKITLATSGQEALDLASNNHFQLVVMDLQMPGMDGIETTTRLRDISGYELTPIIALTANDGDEYRILCLSQGMQGYLPKPVDSETLLRTIRQHL